MSLDNPTSAGAQSLKTLLAETGRQAVSLPLKIQAAPFLLLDLGEQLHEALFPASDVDHLARHPAVDLVLAVTKPASSDSHAHSPAMSSVARPTGCWP
jgi:hypothetical protein